MISNNFAKKLNFKAVPDWIEIMKFSMYILIFEQGKFSRREMLN